MQRKLRFGVLHNLHLSNNFSNPKKRIWKIISYHFPYIYIGCATGYDALARQEVKYCHQIADALLTAFYQTGNWFYDLIRFKKTKYLQVINRLYRMWLLTKVLLQMINSRKLKMPKLSSILVLQWVMKPFISIHHPFLLDIADPKK